LEPPPFLDEPFRELERRAPTALDFFVEEVRLDAAAARCVVLPAPFFEAPFAEERDAVFEPPRAVERAAVFFEEERLADFVDFAADFRAGDFFAAVFLAAVFFAPVLAEADLAVDFFAADFFAVVFLAADFFAVVFLAAAFVLLAAVFRAAGFFAVVFLAALFFAPLLRAPDELRELFLAPPEEVVLDAPVLPILMSLGFDLSSVGMNASFKGLRVHRHACKRQRRYIKRVPINGKCRK
jgi:hypothetical protein